MGYCPRMHGSQAVVLATLLLSACSGPGNKGAQPPDGDVVPTAAEEAEAAAATACGGFGREDVETAEVSQVGQPGAFRKVVTFGDERFLHDTSVSGAVVLEEEIRTVSRGQVWNWSKQGKLLGKVDLGSCSAAHGGAVRDGAFSSNGRFLLVHCNTEGEHLLFDATTGKLLAKAGDFGHPTFCGDHFLGHRPLEPGLRVLDPVSQKVTTVKPKSRIGAVSCFDGQSVVLDDARDLVVMDHLGNEQARQKGPFVKLGPAVDALAVVKLQETELLAATPKTVRSIATIASTYLDVPEAVAMPAKNRIVLWDRNGRRDHVRLVTRDGREVLKTSPSVTQLIFEEEEMWAVSGPRIDCYRLKDGASPTASPANRVRPYRVGDLRMTSSGVVWSLLKEEWVALEVDTGKVLHRVFRPDSYDSAVQDAILPKQEVIATVASGGKVRLLGWGRDGQVLGSGGDEVRSGTLLADTTGDSLVLLDFDEEERQVQIATWHAPFGANARRTKATRIAVSEFPSAHLLEGYVWLMPPLGKETLHRIDIKTGKLKSLNMGKDWLWPRDIISDDGKVFLAGFEIPFRLKKGRPVYNKKKHGIRVYQIGKGSLASRTAPPGVESLVTARIGFVPRTREIWLSDTEQNSIWIFDSSLNNVVFHVDIPQANKEGMEIAFSPDGNAFATQYENGQIDVWRR